MLYPVLIHVSNIMPNTGGSAFLQSDLTLTQTMGAGLGQAQRFYALLMSFSHLVFSLVVLTGFFVLTFFGPMVIKLDIYLYI